MISPIIPQCEYFPKSQARANAPSQGWDPAGGGTWHHQYPWCPPLLDVLIKRPFVLHSAATTLVLAQSVDTSQDRHTQGVDAKEPVVEAYKGVAPPAYGCPMALEECPAAGPGRWEMELYRLTHAHIA